MQKGFGFYSPHETTILFLKASLVSIWIGLDLIVVLVVGSLPQSIIERHTVALNIAGVILAVGTVFSILFAWATGTLFGRDSASGKAGLAHVSTALKGKPYHLIGTGIGAAVVLVLVTGQLLSGRYVVEDPSAQPLGRANLEVARKCTEIASMEHTLFRSDERIVMTQCMLQYDRTYASLRN